MQKFVLALCLLAYCWADEEASDDIKDIEKRSAAKDQCYRCSTWDALGQGFMEASDNPPNCHHYHECWKSKNTGKIQGIDRWCPPGTYTDYDDIRRGAPCTSTRRRRGCMLNEATASTPMWYPCPYKRLSTPYEFGMLQGTRLVKVGTCGVGGFFDDNDDVCTCTVKFTDCTCKVSMPLVSDIDTHSCNGGKVFQLGMPAMATIFDKGGGTLPGCTVFHGFQPSLNNGDHLGTYVIDGAFAGNYVDQLKWTVGFQINRSFNDVPDGTVWGLVGLGDCAAGSAFAFQARKVSGGAKLVAILELVDPAVNGGMPYKTELMCDVPIGSLRYAAAIFINGNNPSFLLYNMNYLDWIRCATGSDLSKCPTPSDACASANPSGHVTPRGCGFVVGHTGSDDKSEFLDGIINYVSVDIKPGVNNNIHPCL